MELHRNRNLEVVNSICDTLRDMVTFVQFKKHENSPWRSVAFSKVTDYWKITRKIISESNSWNKINLIYWG